MRHAFPWGVVIEGRDEPPSSISRQTCDVAQYLVATSAGDGRNATTRVELAVGEGIDDTFHHGEYLWCFRFGGEKEGAFDPAIAMEGFGGGAAQFCSLVQFRA